MDSKLVTKQITKRLKPFLKENGFTINTGRNYWRHNKDRIDIVNFQSFNSYLADSINCTTFSFKINYSVYLPFIPCDYPRKEKNGLILPQEYQGHIRGGIDNNDNQGDPHSEVWKIEEDGSNLDDIFSKVEEQFRIGLTTWFDKFHDLNDIMNLFIEGEESFHDLWGFGQKECFVRWNVLAYTAFKLGLFDIARINFEKIKQYTLDQIKREEGDRWRKEELKYLKIRLATIEEYYDETLKQLGLIPK